MSVKHGEYEIEENPNDPDASVLCPWELSRGGAVIAHFMGEAQAIDYMDYLIDQDNKKENA